MNDHPRAVRALVESQGHGVLATLSTRHNGWPFASIAPYALTERGEPLLLLSTLAEHTRNIVADPRASLFVYDSSAGPDPQAGSRVTLLGTMRAASDASLQSRYLARHPGASDYFALADFGLYVLHVEHARFVAGFGDMGWLDAAALARAADR